MGVIKLGLIGDNIVRSQAPLLHRVAGRLCGLEIDYQRLVPRDRDEDFDTVFDACMHGGFRGINITYPYKERAAARVRIGQPLVQAIGAVNTVLFGAGGPEGYNTDYSGFVSGYRNALGQEAPGSVCMIGAGGVGKAVAFGLLELGLESIRIVERDLARAEALAGALCAHRPGLPVEVSEDTASAACGVDGLINCTPVGMVGYAGTPLPGEAMMGARWAFDAVYTPVETQFLRDARAAGLRIMNGYELFFYQGVNAFEIFCNRHVDEQILRQALMEDGE